MWLLQNSGDQGGASPRGCASLQLVGSGQCCFVFSLHAGGKAKCRQADQHDYDCDGEQYGPAPPCAAARLV